LFSFGDYVPLTVTGQAADHVVAFARRFEDECVIVVVPRHYYQLSRSSAAGKKESGPPRADWADTLVIIPDDFSQQWQCELSGRAFESSVVDNQLTLAVANLFEVFPVAVLKTASI
jgi:(1->4)-alpha-D-glucan 1-alpha-D-glucosylmutase